MSAAAHAHDDHRMPLWGLFLTLLAFTAFEVGLYETWNRMGALDAEGVFHSFIPKLALVLIIFAFTIPKAAIVMIYFMHLKFEKPFVVALSISPFIFAAICIFTTLVDGNAVSGDMYTRPAQILGHGSAHDSHEGGDLTAPDEGESAAEQAGGSDEDY